MWLEKSHFSIFVSLFPALRHQKQLKGGKLAYPLQKAEILTSVKSEWWVYGHLLHWSLCISECLRILIIKMSKSFKSFSLHFLALMALDNYLTPQSPSSLVNIMRIITPTTWDGLRIPDNVYRAWPLVVFSVGSGWHPIFNQNSAERSNLQGKCLTSYALHLFFQIFLFTSGLSQITRNPWVCNISACQDVYTLLSLGKMPWAFSGERCSDSPRKPLYAPCECAVRMWFTAWHSTLLWIPRETFLSDLNISNNCFFWVASLFFS